MIDIFTAKVPITYTEVKEQDGETMERVFTVGYFYTSNLLFSMQEHKKTLEGLLGR